MKIGIFSTNKHTAAALRKIFVDAPRFHISWLANSCRDVLEKLDKNSPELIIIDLDDTEGVIATKMIMHYKSHPILLVTSNMARMPGRVFEAMGYGAIDAVELPYEPNSQIYHNVTGLFKKIETISNWIGPKSGFFTPVLKVRKELAKEKSTFPLLVIGASSGGPLALATIISQFPKNFNMAIVIIQHINEMFAAGLAKWLSSETSQCVEIVTGKSSLEPGKILMAGKNLHLIMNETLELNYIEEPMKTPYRPSINLFFKSVAENWPNKFVGLLLTGMGADGVEGLKLLRSYGWHTITQSPSSCAVSGMPKAAIEADAVEEILPLENIAERVLDHLEQRKGR